MLMRIAVFLAAVLLLVQGCSPMPVREWPALEGRVLDAQTEEPIEGAFVVVRWIGYGRFSDSQCFHAAVTTTDNQGRYRVEPWRNEQDSAYLGEQRQKVERVHANGYWMSKRTYARLSNLHGVYYMQKDIRHVAERLDYLQSISYAGLCGSAENRGDDTVSFYESLYQEAIAVTGSMSGDARFKKYIDGFRFDLDVAKYGWEVANRKRMEQLKKLEEENRPITIIGPGVPEMMLTK